MSVMQKRPSQFSVVARTRSFGYGGGAPHASLSGWLQSLVGGRRGTPACRFTAARPPARPPAVCAVCGGGGGGGGGERPGMFWACEIEQLQNSFTERGKLAGVLVLRQPKNLTSLATKTFLSPPGLRLTAEF